MRFADTFFSIVIFCFTFSAVGFDGPAIQVHTDDFPDLGLRITTASCKGEKNGHDAQMQDASSVSCVGDKVVVGVYDGHRTDKLAHYAQEKLPERMFDYLAHPVVEKEIAFIPYDEYVSDIYDDKVKMALTYAFLRTHIDGHELFPASGTTAVVALFTPETPKKVTFAWAGDSVAFILGENGSTRLITKPHKPIGAEADRIKKMGGLIQDTKVAQECAPGKMYRLDMSRSLGDQIVGVIPVPDICDESVQAGDVVVLCSDGITEAFWPSDGKDKNELCLQAMKDFLRIPLARKARLDESAEILAAEEALATYKFVHECRDAWLLQPRTASKGFVDDMTVQVCVPYDVKKEVQK